MMSKKSPCTQKVSISGKRLGKWLQGTAPAWRAPFLRISFDTCFCYFMNWISCWLGSSCPMAAVGNLRPQRPNMTVQALLSSPWNSFLAIPLTGLALHPPWEFLPGWNVPFNVSSLLRWKKERVVCVETTLVYKGKNLHLLFHPLFPPALGRLLSKGS